MLWFDVEKRYKTISICSKLKDTPGKQWKLVLVLVRLHPCQEQTAGVDSWYKRGL